ncbi:MAG TPA: PKD domain-containing protein [Nitrososphaera sp.]|nr:PKD domain-containing protein [Nitrososphaera sp.]
MGGEEDDNFSPLNSEPTLGYLTHYKAILAVGEEATFDAHSKFGKPPYSFEWKFNDGIILNGKNVTHSFDLPGKYSFYLTITDGNGEQVTSTELNTNVVHEVAKNEGPGNTTSR